MKFHGLKASKNGLSIFHLLFADDSMVFFRACVKDFLGIKNVLQLFEDSTGQQTNFDKSSVLFSLNCTNVMKQHCVNILGVRMIMLNERYHGLPLFVGHSKNQIF